jgi:hypothetical protein
VPGIYATVLLIFLGATSLEYGLIAQSWLADGAGGVLLVAAIAVGLFL